MSCLSFRRPRCLPFLAFLALLPLAACYETGADPSMNSTAAGMVRLGNYMEEKGQIGPAMDFYRRALASDPENLKASQGLASALVRWGDKESAMDLYSKAVVAHPKDASLRQSYARLLLETEQAAQAKPQYEAALEIAPKDVKSRNGLAVCLDYLGDHEKAQGLYRGVLKDEPESLSTMNNLAYSYILTKDYKSAIDLLEPQIHKAEATPALRQNLALAYGLSGMDVDAQRVAAMDMPPEKVRDAMEYYRRQRAEMAISTAPYVEIGSYATQALAVAQIEKIKPQIAKVDGSFKPVVLPEVSSPGGTPRFTVRMMGCSKPDDMDRLCQTLTKAGIPCRPRANKH